MTALLILATSALASDTLQAADQVAMGRTGIAAKNDNAAISLNPGLLALTERYDFQGMFGYGPTGGMTWGASAMDARTSDSLAGGLFYSGDQYEPPLTEDDLPAWALPGEEIENLKRYHDVGLGLSTPLADRKIGIGVSALVGYFDHDRVGDGWRFDMTAGAGFAPTDALTLGVTARGFVPWDVEDVPFSTGLGARLEHEKLAVAADASFFPGVEEGVPVTFSAGLEQGAGSGRFRGGWRFDAPTQVHALSAGLGLVGDGAAIEYGAWVPVTGGLSIDSTVHMVSIRFSATPEIEPD